MVFFLAPSFEDINDSFLGFKEGILVGEALIRECAAYVLDYENFSGVPPTDLVFLCQHPALNLNAEKTTTTIVSKQLLVPDQIELEPIVTTSTYQRKLKVGSFQVSIEITNVFC